MKQKYYLVGAYKTVPVYFSTKQGLRLGSKMDELVEPTGIENLEIIRELGGMGAIERIVRNYEKNEAREEKNK